MNYAADIVMRSNKQQGLIADRVVRQTLKKEDWIRQAIRERWLMGKRPDGTIIGVYSSYGYASEKHNINPLAGFDVVDLTLTGSLGKGIKISPFGGTQIEIYSTDWKFQEIADKYGEVNFNLSDKELDQVFEMVGGEVLEIMLTAVYG